MRLVLDQFETYRLDIKKAALNEWPFLFCIFNQVVLVIKSIVSKVFYADRSLAIINLTERFTCMNHVQ